ncbi:hypothetical protein M9H77_23879 [Catharanthus roseus]|uniref:Uncharacterized protein n=1 Tax=Catharanthus roseus TaxID=4058 RepID=A0ACC0AUY9_CATRO|nr:hypothetical protein M9H77_23879 [Catharanthus roseus]
MGGMEIIPTLFHDIGWGSLLSMNELFYPMMLYEFYPNLQRGRTQSGGIVITSRVNEKNIAFDDKLLNFILETPEDGMWHKSFIIDMRSFAMLALHEHKKMNFGYIAIEHMLATQFSSTKCLPYGCFLTEVFQHFNIPLFGPNNHIGLGKIYNQNTFKRMEFSKNEEGKLMRRGQEEDSENSKVEEEEEEEGNEPEESDYETEVERIRRETRRNKKQERTEEGQSSVDTAQIMDRIAAMQSQLNDQLDDIN